MYVMRVIFIYVFQRDSIIFCFSNDTFVKG